jgi:hypothetical protein
MFQNSQNHRIKWFDDDFIEYGFEDENLGLYEKFSSTLMPTNGFRFLKADLMR